MDRDEMVTQREFWEWMGEGDLTVKRDANESVMQQARFRMEQSCYPIKRTLTHWSRRLGRTIELMAHSGWQPAVTWAQHLASRREGGPGPERP